MLLSARKPPCACLLHGGGTRRRAARRARQAQGGRRQAAWGCVHSDAAPVLARSALHIAEHCRQPAQARTTPAQARDRLQERRARRASEREAGVPATARYADEAGAALAAARVRARPAAALGR
jgi:hypothetical protein